MLGVILVMVGSALMVFGIVILTRWLGGAVMFDRELWFLQFLSLIVAPILGGALAIGFGLRQLI